MIGSGARAALALLEEKPVARDRETVSAADGKSVQTRTIDEAAEPISMLVPAGFGTPFNAPAMQGTSRPAKETKLLTVREVAARLRVSTATVYALCATGRLPHARISTHAIRIFEEDLDGFTTAVRRDSSSA